MCARRSRRRPWLRRFRLFILYLEIAALLVLATGIAVVGGTFYSVSKMLPSGNDLAAYRPTEATKIISSDGVVLGEVFEENRETVPIEDIPRELRDATVAIEDARFYKHLGVDVVGIGRAIYQNFRTGRISQGGSTLTQQLARNIYLTHEKKLSRKLQEIVLALQLERNYSKEQILELYMNEVFYGSRAYGVQTASKVYFGKNVKDLTLAECALLAGLPQRPSDYSPYEDMDAAVGRRNMVLKRMEELGYITPEQREEAKTERVKLVGLKPMGQANYKAPWFVNYVVAQLIEKYGEDLVYRGGLRVHTTLNYEMQKIAEEELRRGIAERKWMNITQGALICIEPQTGHIKAMVGGVDYSKSQYNRAVQARRQPGSSFKAFVYTAAIDNGYSPDYRLSNARVSYPGGAGKSWSPRNYDGRYGGSYTIKNAVAKSVNICAVRMAQKIGIDQVITYARLLGIKSHLEPNLPLALGASGVTPLEMCSAYGVFAANGMRAELIAIARINEFNGNRDGSIIEENKPVTHQVLSQQTAEIMNDIFRGVVTSGTGRGAISVPNAHGKTGTTSSDRDAWFIGYTPELVTAVWVGNDEYTSMKGAFGSTACIPVWRAFMLKALEIHKKEVAKEPKLDIVEAEQERRNREETRARRTSDDTDHRPERSHERTVTICADSGELATPRCPTTYRVTYEPGSAPPERCSIHGVANPSPDEVEEAPPEPENRRPASPPDGRAQPAQPRPGASGGSEYIGVTICVDSGHIANQYCPETITRRYPAADAPTKVCRFHKPPE